MQYPMTSAYIKDRRRIIRKYAKKVGATVHFDGAAFPLRYTWFAGDECVGHRYFETVCDCAEREAP